MSDVRLPGGAGRAICATPRRASLPSFMLLAILALGNGIILWTDSSPLRLLAGLALLYVLPGIAWLAAFDWLGTRRAIERIVLTGGLSSAIAGAAMLAAVYWPQPLDLGQTLVALDAATLAGVIVCLVRARGKGVGQGSIPADITGGYGKPPYEPAQAVPGGGGNGRSLFGLVWPPVTELIILLVILGIAIFLRWYTLGYGEFHEDEIENMQYAVRAMKGEEYAPFLDSKGPIHWLLPAALWLMHGWVNEAIARVSFAISSTLTVLAAYVLGRRVAGPAVALIGSAFVAVNGLLVAYARHVESPSLIVLWAVLAAWCAYRFYELRETPGRASRTVLVVGWWLLGIGLVAHPNMILYLPAYLFVVGMAFRRSRELWRHDRLTLLAGVLVFLALTAAFYVPFVRDPNFQHAVEYYSEERVGTQLLYNQAADLLAQESEYSSRFYTPWLVLLSAVAIFSALRRVGRTGVWLVPAAGAAILTTLLWPALWVWGPINAAFIPYALACGAIALSANASLETKTLVLWFGVPYVALAFFARDAATHIRNVHPFWALLAGAGFVMFWHWLRAGWGRALRLATVAVLGICLGATLFYEHLQYLGTVADYWRAEANARYADVSVYRIVYGGLPRPRKLVSNPRLGGWKVVGMLFDRGQLQGDFRTVKESFAVPIWYTHQTPRSCFEDPDNYLVAMGARGLPDEFYQLPANGYGLTRQVLVDEQPRLYVLEKGRPAPTQPVTDRLDDYRASFDRSATPARYAQEPSVQHPLQVSFGGKLLLRGYDITTPQLGPGNTLALSLHWQALSPMYVRYRAFVHVESDRMWGQHDDDPVCRLRTDEWRPPQAGVGQFRVQIDPATPPGSYPITVGIYDPDTGERLEAIDEQGQSLGSAIQLTMISVQQ